MADDTKEKEEEQLLTDKPNWKKWYSCRTYEVYLRDAVALSCDFEADMLDYQATSARIAPLKKANFDSRLEVAHLADGHDLKLHWVVGGNDDDEPKIRLCDFARWALDKQARKLDLWESFPKEFLGLAVREPTLLWPWGRYTTTLLDALKDAVEAFWKDQDPEIPPTDDHSKKKVRETITSPTISATAANAIDKIIRHNLSKHVSHRKPNPRRGNSSAKS